MNGLLTTAGMKNGLGRSAARAAAWIAALGLAWLIPAGTLQNGLPAGIVFKGVVFGALYGLIAIGLVLIYRANRVVNFAQAEFGAVAAVLAIDLLLHWHVPYLIAVPAGLLIALLTGAFVNAVVISRFRRAPRLILSVATIGLAQILSGIAVLIPLAIGSKSGKLGATQFTTPFKAGFTIRPVLFNANYVVTIVAVIGKMENIPRTVIAAICIGVFENAAIWTTSNTVIVDALLLPVILIALLLQRDFFQRALETGIASFKAIREIRPVPKELQGLPEVELAGLALSLLLLAGLAVLPFMLPPGKQQLAALIVIYAVIAVSLVVLTGWAGQISLGQFALVGFGGATTGVLYQRHHWDFMYAAVAGILVPMLVSLLIGLPALRIRGPFLAVTTLAFAVSASTYFLSPQYFSWFVPTNVDRPVLWGRI